MYWSSPLFNHPNKAYPYQMSFSDFQASKRTQSVVRALAEMGQIVLLIGLIALKKTADVNLRGFRMVESGAGNEPT